MQLDRIAGPPAALPDEEKPERDALSAAALQSPRVNELRWIVHALSTTTRPSSQSLLPSWRIEMLLAQSGLVSADGSAQLGVRSAYESEMEWLVVSKATVQTYGLILQTLLDNIIPINDDIWYWDDVLGSYTYTNLYMLQTSPIRLWAWTREISQRTAQRMRQMSASTDDRQQGPTSEPLGTTLSRQWRQFYDIVRDSIRERSVMNLQQTILSPLAPYRSQVMRKQSRLRKLREMTASGLGILVDEGLNFESAGAGEETKSESTSSASGAAAATAAAAVAAQVGQPQEWKGVVERNVALMDMVLRDVLALDTQVSDFEDRVFAGVEEDPELSIHIDDTDVTEKPAVLARRLLQLLRTQLPAHVLATRAIVKDNGTPSRLVRYWLPVTVGLLSSTTLIKLALSRREDILNWVRDLGATVRNFFFDWVVEPIRRVLITIRHDENSEIAIMSRESLRADQASLERMVVEFARDRPTLVVGASSVTDSQLAEIRAKVKDGDVTPVLMAYERDLRTPLRSAIQGDLVRTLLIQVQKTKVDLEVAMSGIDALLKSQELVFGFIGVTPGVLVSVALFRYLRGMLGDRKGVSTERTAGRSERAMFNIDRILSKATPSQNNLLSYKDHGLLLCEVHVLRQLAHSMPGNYERAFLEDLDDLANINGIHVQAKALDRIRRAYYSRWLK